MICYLSLASLLSHLVFSVYIVYYFIFILILKIALYGWFIKKNDPMQLLNWSFDWKYMVRGLVLDKKRGNILKVDSVLFFFAILLPNSA